MAIGLQAAPQRLGIGERLIALQWPLVRLLCMIASVGLLMLYSAAGGSIDPWAKRQAIRFGMGLTLLLIIALTDIRVWLRFAYWIYAATFVLLVAVEIMGTVGKGAERWIDLGFFQLQPSELMKVALVLALARYFHSVQFERVSWLQYLIPPALLVGVPAVLVLRQPDLGTALLLVFEGTALLFLAGLKMRYFIGAGLIGAASVPIGWQFLRDYQRSRILTFLTPERDPLGAGYHITQSKIAFGSGGLSGRGFLQGPQSHLNFLPEKQTDFIFTALAEEFGFVGGMALLLLYLLVIAYLIALALQVRHQFGRLLIMGIAVTFFLYVFINTAMVMGLIPVVGVPLPLVSYGGTSMLTLLIGFGLVLSAAIDRNVDIPRYPSHL